MTASLQLSSEIRRGPFHFLCVPGLVPDGPECFARQLPLLRRFGSVTLVSYPQGEFNLDLIMGELDGILRGLEGQGQRLVLFGVSVGGGLCLELMRRAVVAGNPLPLDGSILVSPLTCTDDLAPLLKRLMVPILDAHDRGEDAVIHIERGRAFFRGLASRALGTDGQQSQPVWVTFLRLFTPAGLAALRERGLRRRIMETLDNMSAEAALTRVASLRELRGLDLRSTRVPLCTRPTQILWGAKERHTLDMDGPGTGRLCRPDLATRWFPDLEVQWVYGPDAEEIPHASLLRHAGAFNAHLRRYLGRIAATRSVALPGQFPLPIPGALRWAR